MILTCVYMLTMTMNPSPEYSRSMPVECKIIKKSQTIGDDNEVQQYYMDCSKGLTVYDGMMTKRTHHDDGTEINPKVRWFSKDDCYDI